MMGRAGRPQFDTSGTVIVRSIEREHVLTLLGDV